jgi:hypothetical protein
MKPHVSIRPTIESKRESKKGRKESLRLQDGICNRSFTDILLICGRNIESMEVRVNSRIQLDPM